MHGDYMILRYERRVIDLAVMLKTAGAMDILGWDSTKEAWVSRPRYLRY